MLLIVEKQGGGPWPPSLERLHVLESFLSRGFGLACAGIVKGLCQFYGFVGDRNNFLS